MLPKGVYGCESAPINESAMQKLRTAIANCLTFVTSRRATDFTFSIASGKTDVDPDVEECTGQWLGQFVLAYPTFCKVKHGVLVRSHPYLVEIRNLTKSVEAVVGIKVAMTCLQQANQSGFKMQ